MPRVFHFTALLVLAVWMPATVHCDLESMLGWAVESCCEAHCRDVPASAEHCAVESGDYFANQATVTVAAPELAAWWGGAMARLDPPVARILAAPDHVDSPPELTRTWQFVARAALPARAPSPVS